MDRYKVNICGWYNHNNCGDEAYKIAFPIILPENFDITFTDKPIKSDIYILGGGDIVSNYFIDSFQKINAPKHIISTTIRNDINFKNLSQFSTILVRDYQSMKILNDNNILSKYCPDATFALTPNVDNGKKIIKDAKLVGHKCYHNYTCDGDDLQDHEIIFKYEFIETIENFE